MGEAIQSQEKITKARGRSGRFAISGQWLTLNRPPGSRSSLKKWPNGPSWVRWDWARRNLASFAKSVPREACNAEGFSNISPLGCKVAVDSDAATKP